MIPRVASMHFIMKLWNIKVYLNNNWTIELFLLAHHGERTGSYGVSRRCAEQRGDAGGGRVGEGGGGLRECGPVVDEPRGTGVSIGGGEISSGYFRLLLLARGTGKYWRVFVKYGLIIEISNGSPCKVNICLFLARRDQVVILLFLFLQVITGVFTEDKAL